MDFQYALFKLTEHLIFDTVNPGYAEAGVGVCVIPVNGELPVVDSAGESDTAECYTVLVALTGDAAVVLGEVQVRTTQARVKCEPSHWKNNFLIKFIKNIK